LTTIIGPILICLGAIGLIYGVYMLMFANRDTRPARQKNLDSIAEMRGDKKPQKAAKKLKPAKK
jgi:hypothetical protein